MEAIKLPDTPETIEQAVKTLTELYSQSLPQITAMSQKDFKVFVRFGAGMFLRNTWYLWWHEGHYYDKWPKQKPELVKYFNNLGVVHPDDMSSILIASLYCQVHNMPLAVEAQVENHKDYWRKAGFVDGIPK